MLVFTGAPALSDFRLARIHDLLKSAEFRPDQLAVREWYLVDAEQLPVALQQQLETMLAATLTSQTDDFDLLVTPRAGTISPWSSKATDIARNCGLAEIARIERVLAWSLAGLAPQVLHSPALAELLHDRMTETVLYHLTDAESLFCAEPPRALATIDVLGGGEAQLEADNQRLGFALSADEISYLASHFESLGRNPSDAELMMFAQANSEHCRHKIFNADWRVDGVDADASLFSMIRETHRANPQGTLIAYDDNAAIIAGEPAARLLANAKTGVYETLAEAANIQIKVETHNHPTAISPFAGAATGSGGEIRDEGATGTGAKPKAGLCGFSVSNLRIPGFEQKWETSAGKPGHIASALQIMLDGPIGAAAFNNEFGRPNLAGYFRTLEMPVANRAGADPGDSTLWHGYHKPIMIAGGLGNIRPVDTHKRPVPAGSKLVVLGGPSMLIGLGGGAASSMASGQSDEALDFASVQRGNPEMQRRCQEVINHCVSLGEDSPILSIHDVGAGGLSNAMPELVHDADKGASLELREIPCDEPGMSPMEIWCNESQERYVLAIDADRIALLEQFCRRERCSYAVLGEATEASVLLLEDSLLGTPAVDMSLDALLGKPPKMHRDVKRYQPALRTFDGVGLDLDEAVQRVLRLPAVAAKQFLITIGDRTVGGLSHRDQMVGPWQMPVADAAVTLADFEGYSGEAMAMGERAPVAMIDAAASGRMAIAEALMNLCSAGCGDIARVRLSANWMAAAGHGGADAELFDTVKTVAREMCPTLGLSIPVGKDSLSMKTVWQQDENECAVVAPLSLIVSAFAAHSDVRRARTPQLQTDCGETILFLADLGAGRNRLGGSALAQVYGQVGDACPDVDRPEDLRAVYTALQSLLHQELILACHDRSDGGLMVTVAEMCFAGNCGASLVLNSGTLAGALFSEEIGMVFQVRGEDAGGALEVFKAHGVDQLLTAIGTVKEQRRLLVSLGQRIVLDEPIERLRALWWQTSYQLQKIRDNQHCAEQEYAAVAGRELPRIEPRLSFDPADSPAINTHRPQVAILREQGVNGHIEMAAAFMRAGFEAIDVHMTDIISGAVALEQFSGLVACGGFSYGDVLGAGTGWASSIRYNSRASDQFRQFFARDDVFALGVCNGCQMMSQLRDLIPGASHWPDFMRNRSEQFEARLSTVLVEHSHSILFTDMHGSRIPVAVAHGEGRVEQPQAKQCKVTLSYVDTLGDATERYPLNPNGSSTGATGFCNDDGRFNIMMPHPERVFRSVQHSWCPPQWGEDGPWLRMFRNARVWCN